MVDQNALASYRRGLARTGQPVTVQRWSGQAPNKTKFEAVVNAFVRNYTPDDASVARTDSSESKLGAITQGERHVILLACDLQAAGFPMPVKKNDKIIVQEETLNVTEVDPNTRIFAGAIDITVAGV